MGETSERERGNTTNCQAKICVSAAVVNEH